MAGAELITFFWLFLPRQVAIGGLGRRFVARHFSLFFQSDFCPGFVCLGEADLTPVNTVKTRFNPWLQVLKRGEGATRRLRMLLRCNHWNICGWKRGEGVSVEPGPRLGV